MYMISFNPHGNSKVTSDYLHISRSGKEEIIDLKFKPSPRSLEPRCCHDSMLSQDRPLKDLKSSSFLFHLQPKTLPVQEAMTLSLYG